jgi:hypothetical protein
MMRRATKPCARGSQGATGIKEAPVAMPAAQRPASAKAGSRWIWDRNEEGFGGNRYKIDKLQELNKGKLHK